MSTPNFPNFIPQIHNPELINSQDPVIKGLIASINGMANRVCTVSINPTKVAEISRLLTPFNGTVENNIFPENEDTVAEGLVGKSSLVHALQHCEAEIKRFMQDAFGDSGDKKAA